VDQARPPARDTRRALKAFGVRVTDFEERARALLERSRGAASEREQESIRAEGARLTADLHQALREIQGYVYQLQSDFLMELVVREGAGAPPSG
jgi:hypothetical protein